MLFRSQDYDFSKTIVPIKLARCGNKLLISHSQAKRLIARFDRFRVDILDFDGVHEIGPAFASELFREYRNAHPNVELSPINVAAQIERMWLRANAATWRAQLIQPHPQPLYHRPPAPGFRTHERTELLWRAANHIHTSAAQLGAHIGLVEYGAYVAIQQDRKSTRLNSSH